MKYNNYKSISRSLWKSFVENHSDSNIFHSVEFSTAIEKSKKSKPIVISQEQDGEILALAVGYVYSEFSIMIFRRLTQRALFQGGILLSKKADIVSFLSQLAKSCKENGAIYSNIVQYDQNKVDFKIIQSLNYEVIPIYNYIFNLEQEIDSVWNNFKSKKRQNIRKSLKNGLIVKTGKIDDLNEVYACISYTYKKLNLPIFDFNYLDSIYKNLDKKNMIKVLLATFDNKIIATRISLYYNNKAYDWYAGSYDGYNKFNANDVLVWESIKQAAKNNSCIFDFGGAGKQGQEYGVRDYKSKFGGNLMSFFVYKKIHYGKLNKLIQLGKKII